MGKPYPNKNGFTLVEMLVVLLIVSMLGFGLSTKMHCSLYVFMKNLQTLCITAQEKAYVKHRKVYVEIGDSIYMDDVEYKIPHDIACDHVSFYYNAKGNMSKAMSLHCQNALELGGFVLKKNNGFLLEDALFAFFVILICASLILNGIYTLYFQRNLKIDEKIEKKWFYSD